MATTLRKKWGVRYSVRVLYDHQVFSLQDRGGASRYHFELMRYMADVPDVSTWALLGMSGSVYPFGCLSNERFHLKRLRGVLKPGKARYILNEIAGNIWSARDKVDIYHPTLYRRMPLVKTRKLVVTHHDCIHERFPESCPGAKRVVAAKRRIYAEADAIICVSESSRNDLLEFYAVDASRTRVIHHGLSSLPGFAGTGAQLSKFASRPYLLYVGARGGYKGFDRLLNAFSSTGLNHWMNLLVLGGGALTRAELASLEKLKLRSSVVNLPLVTESLLGEAYATATLLVYPSRYEGFGFPPLEAMAAGCPAVVNKTSSLPEVCLDAPFYFDPDDETSLGRAILEAVEDEEKRRHAIKRGREVAAAYRWDKCGEETLALYREC